MLPDIKTIERIDQPECPYCGFSSKIYGIDNNKVKVIITNCPKCKNKLKIEVTTTFKTSKVEE